MSLSCCWRGAALPAFGGSYQRYDSDESGVYGLERKVLPSCCSRLEGNYYGVCGGICVFVDAGRDLVQYGKERTEGPLWLERLDRW
jgi:hypothetical protein